MDAGAGAITSSRRANRIAWPNRVLTVGSLTVRALDHWLDGDVPGDVHARWLALLAASDGPSPVQQAPAMLAATAHQYPAATTRILVIRDDDGDVVGIQPVRYGPIGFKFKTHSRTLLTVAMPGVALVGSEPLADAETKAIVLQAVLRHLAGARVIELNELDNGGDINREVVAFAAKGHRIHRIGDRGIWSYVNVPRSVGDYEAGLGKKKRYNLKRQERLLADHLGGQLDLVVVRDATNLGVLADAARRLTGWPADRLDVVEHAAEQLARAGIVHCFVLVAGDRPVGLIRASAWGNTLHVHSMHHDGTLEEYSPGTAVWQAALKWLIERQAIRRVVFAYGIPAQSHRAISVAEDRTQVLLFRKSLWSSSIIMIHRTFVAGKALMKAVKARARPRPHSVTPADPT